MTDTISRRGVLRATAVAAGAAGAFGALSSVRPSPKPTDGYRLASANPDAEISIVVATLAGPGVAFAVTSTDGVLSLSEYADEGLTGTYSSTAIRGSLPSGFVPSGISVSGDSVSVFGGEWVTDVGEAFERGIGAVTVPEVAASETIEVATSTETAEVRALKPVAYEYSMASQQLTRAPSPSLANGSQSMFIETVLPGAASIIGVIDDEDAESMKLTLALWNLDGSLLPGAVIGVASAIRDVILPVGSGSLFSFVQTWDEGPPKVTPTLLGLLPLSLDAIDGAVIASARTASGSVAIVETPTGDLVRWAPLAGWTTITPALQSGEYIIGLGGGAPDPAFAITSGISGFRLAPL